MSHPTTNSIGHAYRADIDGLRALAVVPVMLYHAALPGFSGGFIGVDIFFVISGFLITGIITREIDAGQFSLLTFYERRARRILPALLAMIAFVLIAASWLFLPNEFEQIGPSALAAIAFVANLWMFTQTGYFQGVAETTPLLHTWSLGVEEQFYIGVPILLILIARYAPNWRMAMLIALSLISFVWAVWKQADPDSFAFYMLPTRAWELFAGSLLALGLVPQIRNRLAKEAITLTALAAIVWATFSYNESTVFPGVTALVPVLAASALIHSAPGTWTGHLLSMRIPVWIGLVSYSLYLWHWPLIVFWNYSYDGVQGPWASVGLIAVSFALAWASWRLIEQPFRNKSRFPTLRLWRWSIGGMGLAAAASIVLAMQGGWESRFDRQSIAIANAATDYSPMRFACTAETLGTPPEECTHGAPVPPIALVWGDSYGVEVAWVLGEHYGARGHSIAQRTRPSCPPALGYDPAKDPECALFNANTLDEISRSATVETIILSGSWVNESYREARVDKGVSRTIAELQKLGKQVVLIGPIPSQHSSVPRLLAHHGANAPTLPVSEHVEKTGWFTQNFEEWRALGARIIEPLERMSRDGQTIIIAGNKPLYYDKHHLSLAGARYLLEDHPALRSKTEESCDNASVAISKSESRDDDKICDHRPQGPDGSGA